MSVKIKNKKQGLFPFRYRDHAQPVTPTHTHSGTRHFSRNGGGAFEHEHYMDLDTPRHANLISTCAST